MDYRNSYITSLRDLSQSGKTMDTAALFPVPIELFDVIDDDNGDPNDYLQKITDNCRENMQESSRALFYLQVGSIASSCAVASFTVNHL